MIASTHKVLLGILRGSFFIKYVYDGVLKCLEDVCINMKC